MGKHSVEKERKINYKLLLFFLIIILLLLGLYFLRNNIEINNKTSNTSISEAKTIEGKKIVVKSTSDFNKIIEFDFKKKILSSVKIYEQFELQEKYKEKKKNYEFDDTTNITYFDDNKFILEIEKTDFGTDEGLTYEQVYDKYVVQIIGAYEVI